MLDSLRSIPPVTRALLILIVLVYAGQAASQTLISVDLLEFVGVRYNPDIAAGQWWRLLTPVFLHGSFLHLAMNGLALYRLGPQLEATYGRVRYLALFVVAGLAGSLAGFAFSPFASLGASGAIFGLLGAAAVFFFQHRALFGQAGPAIQQNLISVAMINLMISFLPGIDGWGHAGGFVGGVLMAIAIGPRMALVRQDPWTRMISPPDPLMPLAEDEDPLSGRSPFALVDTRPPGQRTWFVVAAAITFILVATSVMASLGSWARPLLRQ